MLRVSRVLALCCVTAASLALSLVNGEMPGAVSLGTANSFSVLAGQTITNTGPSTVKGSIGIHPGTALTGFPPGHYSEGVVHLADGEALQAQTDLKLAYNDAAGRTPFIALASSELGGRTLVAGVYRSTGAVGLTGSVYLDAQGNPDSVWIFQIGSAITTATSASVVLLNGAQACNVFWQVSSSATLGTGTKFVGTILALTSISVKDGVTINGRLFARNGAVTLINNQIKKTTCGAENDFEPFTPPKYPSCWTPTDGSGADTCQLSGLQFTSGLAIVGSFASNKYSYVCSAAWTAATFTTVVRPLLLDESASAEIRFNGVSINDRDTWNAISNNGAEGPLSRAPLSESSPLTFREGTNTIVINIVNLAADCNYAYTISCDKPHFGSGGIVGDPQFVGLRGQQYQVHGISGEIYNIVSDSDLQYNSRFVFLSQGECPVVNGRKQKSCWSHPGSYLGELGLKTKAGDQIHLVTGPAKFGFESVTVNDQMVLEGQTVVLAGGLGSVSRNSTHVASVQIGNWDFVFENSDMFVNQRVRVIDSRGLRSHGLLGQTWREATYPNPIKYIAGQVDDYVIRDNEIFGDNFVFNAFN